MPDDPEEFLSAALGRLPREQAPPPTFALLLYGATSGEDSAAHVARAAEYSLWANASRTDSQVIGGQAIGGQQTALVWNAAHGVDSVAAEEPAGDPTKLVGYFLVQAASRDAAVKLAWNCPHLKYGGRVVVRAILANGTAEAIVLARDPSPR